MTNLSNSVQLIGNLGRDAEFKQMESGKKLAKVSIATKDIYKSKEGEKVVDVQWHNLIGWDKVAENMQVYFKKGKSVAVKGKLIHRSYEDKEGQKRYLSEVMVREFMLLG